MQSPEEGNSLDIPDQERRVAERREQAARVCHDQDEERDEVSPMLTLMVGLQQRSNQEHARAGRTDDAGKAGTDEQKQEIVPRRRLDIAFEVNPARSRK